MSADTFHHQVEESMKKAENIYDFTDFENAVREADPRVVIKSMTSADFFDWQDYKSQQKLKTKYCGPILNTIKHV